MNLFANVRLSLRGIIGNKLRSALTVLGILIGVGAVILLVAVGNGSSVAVSDQIKSLGTNTITITNTGFSSSATAAEDQSSTITTADVTQLEDKSQSPDIKTVSPVVSASEDASYGDEEVTAKVTGSTPSYFSAEDDSLASGSFFTTQNVTDHSRVAVISTSLADEIFTAGSDPIGKEIKLGTSEFQVIGVISTKSSTSAGSDYSIITPYTSAEDEFTGYGSFTTLVVQAQSSADIDLAESEAAQILAADNHTTVADLPFDIVNESTLLSASQSTTQTFTVLLAAVAGISLLVGGIGIMNIMLVTVTERTREIGIRKAIGAPRSAILLQFLTEATLLSLIGGVGGIVAGIVGSHFTIDGVVPVISDPSVVAAFAVSVLIGVFFGLYPANRAAGLSPIDALRYE